MTHAVETVSTGSTTGGPTAVNRDDRLRTALDELAEIPTGEPRRDVLRGRVIEHAIPLADRLARRFAHRGIPLDDLTQVARLGLVKAVDGYSRHRTKTFTGFAAVTILGELKRHFRDKGWIVRVPRRLQETRIALNDVSGELHQRLGRTPTVDDYARSLGLTTESVREGMTCVRAYDAVSLESPAHPGSEERLSESIGDDDPAMRAVENRVMLRPLLACLPERERRILMLRYADDLTQAQIADRVELSQMHVSRLLRRAVLRLRKECGPAADALGPSIAWPHRPPLADRWGVADSGCPVQLVDLPPQVDDHEYR